MTFEQWLDWARRLGLTDEAAERAATAAFEADAKGMPMSRAADLAMAYARGERAGHVDYSWWERLTRDRALLSVVLGLLMCYGALTIVSPNVLIIAVIGLITALTSARRSWRGFVATGIALNVAALILEFVPGIHRGFLFVAP
jgi:hypothetical protein